MGANVANILPDLSFEVEKGECFGLIGESGSGKSTVLRCISLLLQHWRGDIAIGGTSLRDLSVIDRCRTVQMVFQDPYGSLHPRHSVRTVLQEPLKIHKLDRRQERMEQALEEVGLPISFLDRFPHQLSGGQRQRVAIARALILEPDILLLDEPTSALDVSVQAEILNLLSDLRRRRGFTYILVSHDLAVVDYMCDRFAVMQAGDIVEVLDRSALVNDSATHPYARELISASVAYDRAS
ncbi:ABC transporter ATP-binding protein [Devosia sp. XJ19-1]|uniref:Glutathione import ATP-binding protein GsiA n=2 Tax=Devosia ureilytica TaxID=2952754 RepID=A0A9Q4ARJ3_9HYPH|nr:ABC transporter ATP-binding protein [Devosia ureilytica]MCP8884702.1 ABC transporter ATP-binding protein [Devosia ureilytica]MCP8888333.1 ABC transporter ATP-binding protein [Devosia ureilytica]